MNTFCPAFQRYCNSSGQLISCSQCLERHNRVPVQKKGNSRHGFRVGHVVHPLTAWKIKEGGKIDV